MVIVAVVVVVALNRLYFLLFVADLLSLASMQHTHVQPGGRRIANLMWLI